MRRIGKRGLIAIGIVVAIVIPLSIFVIIPVAQGSTRFLVVLSGSMSPAMDPGDVAVVTRINPSELKVGDIVAYANNPKNIVSHRVVEVIDENGMISFRTKGDANEDPDLHIVRSSDVVGKVAFTIPYAGYIFHYARKPVGFVLLVMVPAVLLIAIEARRIASHVKGQSQKGRSQKGVGKGISRCAASLPLAASLLLIFLTSVSMTPTGAYFHDVEVSTNNVIAAGVWTISGEIVDFIVPERVILDEVAEFTVLFKNTGDVSLAARAFVEVRKGKEGKIVATENGALVEVGVGETIDLEVQWNTSGASPGNYWGIAWVCFDSASTSTTEPEKFKVKHDNATEFVVSGKHVAQISTGDDSSNIDNSMLDNSTSLGDDNSTPSLGDDNSMLDNSTSLGDDNSVPDNSTPDTLGDDNSAPDSLGDNSAPDSDASLGDDNSVPDNSTSGDALLDDNSAPDNSTSDASLGDDNSDASLDDNSVPDSDASLGDDNSTSSSGEDSSALDNSDDSTSQEIGDNATFLENDNSVIMDEGAFGNNDVSARDNGTILENEGATYEGVTEENSDFDEGTSEVSENASPDDDSAPDNSSSPEIGGAENSTINNEGSGLAENSSADNENAGLAENTITDNENPNGGTPVDGCTENSEVTENMVKDNENPDVVENTLANDENSEVGGVVQVPLDGI